MMYIHETKLLWYCIVIGKLMVILQSMCVIINYV